MTNWLAVSEDLEASVPQEMFVHQKFKNEDDFLACLVPPEDQQGTFFGTRAQTLFVVSYPYGWKNGVFIARDSTTAFAVKVAARVRQIELCNRRYPAWKAVIYGDMEAAKTAQSMCPTSDAPRMMERTIGWLQEVCNYTPGLEYGGTLDGPQTAGTFSRRLTDWYGQPLYRG